MENVFKTYLGSGNDMKKILIVSVLITLCLSLVGVYALWVSKVINEDLIFENSYFSSGDWRIPLDINVFDHDHNVVDIQTRNASSLVLTKDGTIFSWGWNAGALASNTTMPNWTISNSPSLSDLSASDHGEIRRVNSIPVDVDEDDINDYFVTKIDVGPVNSIALDDDGHVWFCGRTIDTGTHRDLNRFIYMQIGDGSVPAVDVAAPSRAYVVLLSDGSIYTWGNGANGVLGHGNTTNQLSPKLVNLSDEFGKIVKISAQNEAVFAVTDQNRIWAWGRNDYGQLGDGTTARKTAPVLLKEEFNNEEIIEIRSGRHHTWVQTTNNIYTWGSANAALGRSTARNANRLPGVLNFNDGDNSQMVKHFSIEHDTALMILSSSTDTNAVVKQVDSSENWQVINRIPNNAANPILVSVGQTMRRAGNTSTVNNNSTKPIQFIITDDGLMYSYGNQSGGALGNGNTGNTADVDIEVKVCHQSWLTGPIKETPIMTLQLYQNQVFTQSLLEEIADKVSDYVDLNYPHLMLGGIYKDRPSKSNYLENQVDPSISDYGYSDPLILYLDSDTRDKTFPALDSLMPNKSLDLYIRITIPGEKIEY